VFDNKVHYFDPKTRRVIPENTNHYEKVVNKNGGTYYIRGGKKYWPNGALVGAQPPAPDPTPALENPSPPPEEPKAPESKVEPETVEEAPKEEVVAEKPKEEPEPKPPSAEEGNPFKDVESE